MNIDLAKTFGANVQRRRKQLGLTQDNLAEMLGIGQHSLSRIERGVLTPKFDRLVEFSKYLHCSVSELFSCSDGDSEIDSIILDILKNHTTEEKNSMLKIVSLISSQFLHNRNK